MTIGEKRYVQYGCGLCAPTEWLNFDSSPTLRVQKMYWIGRFVKKNPWQFPHNVRFGNIVHGLGLSDNSADGVYASHVLEHLTLEEFAIALNNTFKLLKPGAVFRLVVPDLAWRAKQYVASLEREDARASATFMTICRLGQDRTPKTLMSKLSLLFGRSTHQWMWDKYSMCDSLVTAGFSHVRQCQIGDSGDPMFDLVEDRGRFFNEGFPELAFEAKKPPSDFDTPMLDRGPRRSRTAAGGIARQASATAIIDFASAGIRPTRSKRTALKPA
jgi:Methyltransferase domain